ncbi:MAG: D-glycero-beta-D-manno-heptose-7-phosphate kinase [Salinivirgaceae bacterium]|nr:MAG: D-glycero-beta-D-manno-heptose-7-phosphate kinase [Salinivirgaceae bacterium]
MENLEQIFKEVNSKKIMVVGDVMIDSYMWGRVDRISPEAPVPVVSVTKKENRLGGAANVGLNIKAMGAEPILCGIIGNDDQGKNFRKLLHKRNMTDLGLMPVNERPTTVKTRVIASSQHLLRVDEEISDSIQNDIARKFSDHVIEIIETQKPHVIIFEDYDKGNITPEVIHLIVDKAVELKIPVLVDPKKRNFFDYKRVTLFKPNFKELVEGMKISISKLDTEAVANAAERLREQLNAKYVMVTLSEAGVLLTNGDDKFTMPAQKREIADVSGAGDTVISVLACCMAANVDAKTSTVIANIAGGQVCEKIGVVPVEKTQLLLEAQKYFTVK